MGKVGMDHSGSSVPNFLLKQGHPLTGSFDPPTAVTRGGVDCIPYVYYHRLKHFYLISMSQKFSVFLMLSEGKEVHMSINILLYILYYLLYKLFYSSGATAIKIKHRVLMCSLCHIIMKT